MEAGPALNRQCLRMNANGAASRLSPNPSHHRLPWQVSFLLLSTIWGCSFWWIKLGLEMLAPVQVAFVRLAIGAVALAIVAFVTGTRLPRSLTTWRHLLVVALLMNSIPFTLFAIGETHISSILAGIINAMTPLTTLAVILLAFPEEQPTAERIAGLFVGFAGALVVVGIWQGLGASEWIGILACLGAVTGYGIAFPYVRRHLSGLSESGVGLATGQVACGAVVLLPFAIAAGPLPDPVAAGPVAAMLGLGALGSGVAPLFAVLVGSAFLGGSISWNEPVGGLLVIFGVAVAQGRLRGLLSMIRPARRSGIAAGTPGD
jgi:drug/metabolite transporter (DMT)-like permease